MYTEKGGLSNKAWADWWWQQYGMLAKAHLHSFLVAPSYLIYKYDKHLYLSFHPLSLNGWLEAGCRGQFLLLLLPFFSVLHYLLQRPAVLCQTYRWWLAYHSNLAQKLVLVSLIQSHDQVCLHCRWEAIQVFLGRLRVEIRSLRRAHPPLQETHRLQAFQLSVLRQDFLSIGPSRIALETTSRGTAETEHIIKNVIPPMCLCRSRSQHSELYSVISSITNTKHQISPAAHWRRNRSNTVVTSIKMCMYRFLLALSSVWSY